MQFIVTAYDGIDEKAPERRLAVRSEHLENARSMKNEGKLLYAAAILSEDEKMIGSTMIVDFKTRDDLDAWLKIEPYITGDVWVEVDVKPCMVPPMFLG